MVPLAALEDRVFVERRIRLFGLALLALEAAAGGTDPPRRPTWRRLKAP